MQIQSPRLLVVDDEPLNQEIIAEYLDDSPYSLQTADDGAIAWSILESQPKSFDAVLLDRMMPNMDGIEVIERMKKHPELCGVPVIMQTAAAAKDDVVSGLQAGDYYSRKACCVPSWTLPSRITVATARWSSNCRPAMAYYT